MPFELIAKSASIDNADPFQVSEKQAVNSDISAQDHYLDFLHKLSDRLAGTDPLHEVLYQIVDFMNVVIGADSCFIYVLEDSELVLRASKNPHPEFVDNLRIPVGEGITGWARKDRLLRSQHLP